METKKIDTMMEEARVNSITARANVCENQSEDTKGRRSKNLLLKASIY